MGKKIRGSEIELQMVKNCFRNGGIGFNFPGSGTYKVPDEIIVRNTLQKKCSIPVSIPHIDFGYDASEYVTTDYWGYFTDKNIVRGIKIFGSANEKEFRFVEVKTVRLRTSHLKDGENIEDVDPKSHSMEASFSILSTERREFIRITGEDGKKVRVKNPHFGKIRKSDFCIELERCWYLSELFKINVADALTYRLKKYGLKAKVPVNTVPSNAYLEVRFIKANVEIWIPIPHLAAYQDHTLSKEKDPLSSILTIKKDERNNITWTWRRNQKLLKKLDGLAPT